MKRFENYKALSLAAVILAVCSLTLGYAALTQTLNINVGGTVQSGQTTWNIHFEENGKSASKVGNAVLGTMDLKQTTITLSGVTLKTEGDSVTYSFNVVNDGELDAMISVLTPTEVTVTGGTTTEQNALKQAVEYTLKYADGTAVGLNDSLLASEEKEMLLTISLKEGTVLPTSNVSISNIGYTITYVQKTSGGGSNDDLVTQSPTTIGCTLGETPYGVTRTEQNTLCWDGDITKYPSVNMNDVQEEIDGELVTLKMKYVKISDKVINSSNYDGQEYLIHYQILSGFEELQSTMSIDKYRGMNTGYSLNVVFEEASSYWNIEAISTDGNAVDYLSSGTWVIYYSREDTGEPVMYIDAITIPGMDFTGTSTRYEEIEGNSVITSSSIYATYDGDMTNKETIKLAEVSDDGEAFGEQYLVKISDFSEEQQSVFQEFIKKIDTAGENDTVYTSGTLNGTTDELTGTVDEFKNAGYIQSSEKTYTFLNWFVYSFGETVNGVEVPEGIYAVHTKIFDEYVSNFGFSEMYASDFYIKLNF